MTRDQYLTEKILGKCLHEWESFNPQTLSGKEKCNKCGAFSGLPHEDFKLDFSTWSGFGILWEHMIHREEWKDFLYRYFTKKYQTDSKEEVVLPVPPWSTSYINGIFDFGIINPSRFADAVYEYFKGKEQ